MTDKCSYRNGSAARLFLLPSLAAHPSKARDIGPRPIPWDRMIQVKGLAVLGQKPLAAKALDLS